MTYGDINDMTTKEYLEQVRHITKRIQDKIAEAEMWKQVALGGKMGGGDDLAVRVQTSKRYDKMGDAVASYVDYTEDSLKTARRLAELKYTVSKQIDDMPDDIHYSILKSYYILDKNHDEIMCDIGYEKSQYYKHFKSALESFEELYGGIYASA